MNYIKILLTMALLSTLIQADQNAKWQQYQAQQAMKSLDCEFKDCTPKAKPQVIVKEKVVYRDRVVYKDRPVVALAPAKVVKKTPVIAGRTYNKLFIDISAPGDPTFLSDYIYLTQRASGLAWNPIMKKLKNAPTNGEFVLKIAGMIELPEGITSEKIYIQPTMKNITRHLVIGGKPWTTQEMILSNAYKKDRVIPFYIQVSYGNIYRSRSQFEAFIRDNFTDVQVLVSNKPVTRGENKEYKKTRIFINQ